MSRPVLAALCALAVLVSILAASAPAATATVDDLSLADMG